MPLYEKLLEQSATIFNKIYAHPYNQELFRGSLPKEKFNNYLKKDVDYLKEFSQAIARIHVSKDLKPQFKEWSAYIKKSEIGIHHQYFKEKKCCFNFCSFNFFKSKKTDDTDDTALVNYKNHINHASKNLSIEEAIASLLPCFLTYFNMGRDMQAAPTFNGKPNPYADWISYYNDQQFVSAKNFFIDVLQNLMQDVSAEMEQRIINSFLKSAQCELELYDSAYFLSKEEKLTKQAQVTTEDKFLEHKSPSEDGDFTKLKPIFTFHA